MRNFIPLIRADRLREINEYKSRGYVFRDRQDKYLFVRKLLVTNYSLNNDNLDVNDRVNINDKVEFGFQVRNDHKEPRFFIVNEHDNQIQICVYLTIYEIYELLLKISRDTSTDEIINCLQSPRAEKWYFQYSGLEFDLSFYNDIPLHNRNILIPSTDTEISFKYLLILIILIQEKSNYFWRASKKKNANNYINGLIRMLCGLISTQGHKTLTKHGWIYDIQAQKYLLPTDYTGKYDKKYYLTPREFKNIMEVRNPSIRQ